MSARYFQQSHNNENLSIKCNDADVRGTLLCAESVESSGKLSLKADLTFLPNTDGEVSGKITLPALENFQQATANNANVAASTGGVAPQQFMITTFESSAGVGGDIASGASVTFVVFHSGIVAGKTMVLCSKAGSYNGLIEVTDYVSATSAGQFQVTRHNHGSTTASGNQQLIFKLIQSA
tara:strand:- start:297 stop:836 length:540 start_codon:yes stop_codon:yes gene_type:complete